MRPRIFSPNPPISFNVTLFYFRLVCFQSMSSWLSLFFFCTKFSFSECKIVRVFYSAVNLKAIFIFIVLKPFLFLHRSLKLSPVWKENFPFLILGFSSRRFNRINCFSWAIFSTHFVTHNTVFFYTLPCRFVRLSVGLFVSSTHFLNGDRFFALLFMFNCLQQDCRVSGFCL